MKKVLAAALIVLGSQSGAAQLDGCTLGADEFGSIVAPTLVGTWMVQNGAGQMHMTHGGQSMSMAMPPQPPEPITFTFEDGKAIANMDAFGMAEVRPLDPAHPQPQVKLGGVPVGLDAAALGGDPTCAVEDLTRVIFSGVINDPQIGGTLDATFGLYVLDENRMGGVLEMRGNTSDGAQMTARRLVTLTRQD